MSAEGIITFGIGSSDPLDFFTFGLGLTEDVFPYPQRWRRRTSMSSFPSLTRTQMSQQPTLTRTVTYTSPNKFRTLEQQ